MNLVEGLAVPWNEYPLFDFARSGNWYDIGFLIGAGSPLFGAANAKSRSRRKEAIA